jgi:tight adherence protein C
MSRIMAYVAELMAAAAAFLLVYGIYEGFLRRFFEEVQTQDERSLLKSTQKVILSRLGVINRRFMTQRYEIRVRQTLVKAGDPADMKPEEVLGLHEIGAALGLLAGLYAFALAHLGYWVIIVGLLAGGYYPAIWLRDQVVKRHHKITRALPYNIDLLTLSVEAGLDFTAALAKVVEKGKPGPLIDEFALSLRQLKMGKTREQALRTMVERVDLPALTSFLTALIQADRMGTSMGKVLRIQSTQMRIERTQRAEKLANEAPVKMLFPLIACIFPTVFLVLFGPIIYQFMAGGIQ